VGIDKNSNKVVIRIDPSYYRPTEVDQLLGDATKARETLGWKPTVNFDQLVEIMVKADYDAIMQKNL
jgi:GDPmannose 4,6-dehydratase